MEGLWIRSGVAAHSSLVQGPLSSPRPPTLHVAQQAGVCRPSSSSRRSTPKWLRLRVPVLPRASVREIEELVQSGEIPTIVPRDAKQLLAVENPSYKLLDVRPIWEHKRAHVAESLHVPLFLEDEKTDPVTLLKKWIQMGMGGMWLGQPLTMLNEDFVAQVEQALPSKNEKVMVACGEGARSMLAIEELRNAGYTKLAWVAGGFNNVRDGDFATVENGTKLQWATVGGASEYVFRFALLLACVLNSISGSSAAKDQ